MANRWGKNGNGLGFIFLGCKITMDCDCSHEIIRCLLLGRKAMTNLESVWKHRHHFANKGLYSQSCGFSSSHAWMLHRKESWVLKNWCFQTVVLQKTLESPLDSKEIKPVHPKENQHWNVQCSPDVKSWLIGKDPDAGKGWAQEKKGVTEMMASVTQWTWVWANSGRQERTGKAGVLLSTGLQRVGHDWATEQQQQKG